MKAARKKFAITLVAPSSGGSKPLAERLGAALKAAPTRDGAGSTVLTVQTVESLAQPPEATLDTVVYLAERTRPSAETLRHEVAVALAAGARHLVVVSSAEAVAPHHHHPGLIGEEHPRALAEGTAGLGNGASGNGIADGWLALEVAAREAVATQPSDERPLLSILRPSPMPVVGGNDFWSRWLAGSFAPTVAGFDPTVQFLAVEDLAAAIETVLAQKLPGLCHVAPHTAVPLHRAVRLAGSRRLPVPGGLLGLPAERRPYLSHSWTVAPRRLREAGWRSHTSSATAIAATRTGRQLESRSKRSLAASQAAEPYDDYGLDRAYIRRHGRRLIGFAHDRYWRVELAGIEQIPRQGGAVLTGVHRGFMPFDGVMALHAIDRELGRCPRFLIHPALVKVPFLANFITKLGGILACQENADHVLERGGLLGVFPEGIRGAFTFYRRAYRLGRFGRDEYVKMALRHQVPIVPFVTVGSAEIFPILGALHWRWVRRLTEWPFLPVTPTLGLVPLPSKWHTRFLEPLHPQVDHGPEAADDPEVVRLLSNEVRRRMEAAFTEMLARRRALRAGVLRGSIFTRPKAKPEPDAESRLSAPSGRSVRRTSIPLKSTGRTL